MSDDLDDVIDDALLETAETILARLPGYGYVIAIVKPNRCPCQGLNYATNFQAEGLQALGEVLAERDDDGERHEDGDGRDDDSDEIVPNAPGSNLIQ